MNEHLPYEDELMKRLDDLPLPGDDVAWEDMKRRLDEDEDRPIIPPVFKGCGCYGAALLLLAIAALLIIDPAKWFHHKTTDGPIKRDNTERKFLLNKTSIDKTASIHRNDTARGTLLKDKTISLSEKSSTQTTLYTDSLDDKKELAKRRLPNSKGNLIQAKNSKAIKPSATTLNDLKNNVGVKKNYHHPNTYKKIQGKFKAIISGAADTDSTNSDSVDINRPEAHQQADTITKDSVNTNIKAGTSLDSMKKKRTDTTANKKKTTIDSLQQKHIYFGAGIAINQLLPVAGQKSNPYNVLGRKSSLADYIPSVYVRMYRDRKWFIQSEFRYGAPQFTKGIVFVQKKVIDSISLTSTTTSKSVKKTFYHQLPVSFNYFIMPGLSVGAGITFNKFNSALVQQDVSKASTTQPDSLVSSGLVRQKKADSNFVKSYTQAIVEMQYQWKRFSAGARYSFGLQPYLQFTLPGGVKQQEKNTSLQIFIRYELWQSRKKGE